MPKRKPVRINRPSKSHTESKPGRGLARRLGLISTTSIVEQVVAGLLICVIVGAVGVVARLTLDHPTDVALQPPTSQLPPSSSSVPSTVEPASTTTQAPSTTRDPGPPVRISSVTLERSDLQEGWVFPHRVDLSSRELKALNKIRRYSPQYDSWFRSRGGVDPFLSIVKVVVEGNRDNLVRIIGMRAIKHCQAPLTGTVFSDPAAGADDSIMIGFDLDSNDINARIATPESMFQQSIGRGYFGSKTISLKPKEQQVLQVLARTRKHYCEYRLQMTVLDRGKTFTEVVGNGKEPFRVTSYVMGANGVDISRYKAAYFGGVISPTHDSAYVRVDPTNSPIP